MSETATGGLKARLGAVDDPVLDADVVSAGLVEDVTVEEATDVATVTLNFEAPYSPHETAMGEEIRDVVREAGYEPDLTVAPPAGQEMLPEVRNVIAVASGKGGVGKTTVAANLADGLRQMGARTGLVDGDIHGPNVQEMFDVDDGPQVTDEGTFTPARADGLRVMSLGHVVPREDDPAALRGPMIEQFLLELFDGVEWGPLDYLVVDLPPGTGDATMSLLQNVAVTGAVIVTTPHDMSAIDARKGLQLFRSHDTPVLGIVENMSRFDCPNCEQTHEMFGTGGGEDTAENHNVPLLAEVPFSPELHSDDGTDDLAVRSADTAAGDEFRTLVPVVANLVGEVNRRLCSRGDSLEPTPVENHCD